MNKYVECRTCLGLFSDDNSVHVETKVIHQKNVLQAIEEIASVEILENAGLPEYICKNCFKSLEVSITFRAQVISSDIELKKRLIPETDTLSQGNNPPLLFPEKEEDNDHKEDVKEESDGIELLEKQESTPLKIQCQGNVDAGIKSSEDDSNSDWNGFNDNISSSDDPFHEQSNKKSSSKKRERKDETDLNEGNSTANRKVSAPENKDETDISDDIEDYVINNKSNKKISSNGRNRKSSAVPQKDWSDYSDDSSLSENCLNDKERNKSSLKSPNKKTAIKTRKIRRKRIVTKKPVKDISDTSSDSDSDSDVPLEELRKEIKDLNNQTGPKVRKKREKKENGDGPRLCPICGKLFKARQNFNSHMTTVHRKKHDKPEKISCLCPDCGRVISGTRQNFVAHRRYHHSDKAQVKKRFTCDVCPRKFYREKNLIIHQRIHKGEKGYVCELCPDKSYTQIGGLILHKRKVHLKKPTCTCNYCGKQFYEKHYLETHIRQWHTGERPFSCEICGKSFSCNGTLLRHRKDSHGEKQPCPKCGKMYTEGELRKHLKRHKIREEGIKRKKFTCEYCGTEMNFTSRKRHLLKQHSIMLRGRGETAERVPISRADAM